MWDRKIWENKIRLHVSFRFRLLTAVQESPATLFSSCSTVFTKHLQLKTTSGENHFFGNLHFKIFKLKLNWLNFPCKPLSIYNFLDYFPFRLFNIPKAFFYKQNTNIRSTKYIKQKCFKRLWCRDLLDNANLL